MAAVFHHFGVPTSVKNEKESYLEGGKVFITNPDDHPYRVEFLRFEEGSPLPEALQTGPHAAFVVTDLDEALVGQNVVIPPFNPYPNLRCAFVNDGGALIELMQNL